MGWTKNRCTIISLAVAVAAFVTLGACTPEQEDPLAFGARATVRAATPTPTPRPDQPTPTPVPAEEMERVARERSEAYLEALYEPTEGTVRMGIWDDKRVQLDSHLAGYVIVYGYDYAVEMVETSAEEYPGLLETGELDIVLQTSPDLSDWLAERSKDGAVVGRRDDGRDDARNAHRRTRTAGRARSADRGLPQVDYVGRRSVRLNCGEDHRWQAGD